MPALLYSALLNSSLPYSAALCDKLCPTILHFTLLYSTLLYATVLYSTPLHSSLLYSALLYSALLYSTLCYSMLRYPTLLFSTLFYSALLHSAVLSAGPRTHRECRRPCWSRSWPGRRSCRARPAGQSCRGSRSWPRHYHPKPPGPHIPYRIPHVTGHSPHTHAAEREKY